MRRLLVAMLVVASPGSARDASSPVFADEISRLAANHQHGERDNADPLIQRIAELDDGELVSFCAEVAAPATGILRRLGFEARHVALIALHPDADGIHQGHHVVEAWHPDRQRWVIVDIDYGVLFDQAAVSLPAGRVRPEPLEAAARDTEWPGGYPLVAAGVGIVIDDIAYFDPAAYTAAEQAVMVANGWRPWAGDFTAEFYR